MRAMASVEQIAALATAGSTVILSIATFASVRSANRAARAAEKSLIVGTRPVLISSREDDPPMRVGFGDGHAVSVPGHGAAVDHHDGKVYMAISLRNGGSGLALLHGWRAKIEPLRADQEMPPVEDFRRQTRDLVVPPGEIGFWQGAVRDSADPDHPALREAAEQGGRVTVDLLYGDQFGHQRTIMRVSLTVWDEVGRRAEIGRYWNVDGEQAR
jgi:hypothetical protein